MKVEKRVKKVNELRREKIVPGVIYGKKMDSTPIQAKEKDILKAYEEHGRSTVFKIDLEGKKHQVYIKSIQTDVIKKDKIIHFDFIKVTASNTITADIPFEIIGQEEIERKRYLLQVFEHSFEAEYKVGKGIQSFEIDVSKMEIGDSLKIEDLELPKGIKVLEDLGKMILNVKEQPIIEEVEPDLEEREVEDVLTEKEEKEEAEEQTKGEQE